MTDDTGRGMKLQERIDSATTNDHKWNAWPDQLEIVAAENVDLTDPRHAFNYGYLTAAKPNVYRQIRFSNFPVDLKPLLKNAGWDGGRDPNMFLVYCYFTLDGAKGQEDDPETRNIVMITATRDDYENYRYKQGQRPAFKPGLIVKLGCEHDYDDRGSNHTRGYHLGRCTKCGHKYMCDSGD